MNIAMACGRMLRMKNTKMQTYVVESRLIKELLHRGHRITFYTPVSDYDELVKKHGNQFRALGDRHEQQWMTDDEDVFVVINASMVDVFYNKYSWMVYNLIYRWSGELFYLQSDPHLWLQHNRIFIGSKKQYGDDHLVCHRDDIFSTISKINVLVNAMNTDLARKTYTTKSQSYDSDYFDLKFFNICELAFLDIELLGPKYLKSDRTLTYIGNNRGRQRGFKKFYKAAAERGYEVNVYGKYYKEDVESIFKLHGPVFHYNVPQIYNDSHAHFVIFDDKQRGTSAITNRMFESIASGCLTYFDHSIFSKDEDAYMVEPRYLIDSIYDFETGDDTIYREEKIAGQQDYLLSKINPSKVIDSFEKILGGKL